MEQGAASITPPTRAEEWANSITHGIGLVLSVIGLIVLVFVAVATGEAGLVVGCSIFGGTLVFMYTASTLYHSFRAPRLKRLLRILDHIAIYLLIAGTYTPFALLYFDGGWLWTLLCLEWGVALAGVVFKIFFTGRFRILSTLLYLAMGWLAVVALKPLLAAAPLGCVAWMVAGGLLYTGGVAFYVWKRLPYHHAVWHVFVLGGSACHYLALALYL
ncbi:MAG: hemolysin III family protein [Rhodothermales bacterium]